jgi:uncharacterized protein (TIGR03437 family)
LQDAAKRQQMIKFLSAIDAATPPIAPAPASTLTVTSAAWNTGSRLAPDSLASGYGSSLAVQAAAPSGTPLPVALGGTTVSVQDAAGALRLGQLFYVSPGQVNFVVPAATATGRAQITATSGSGSTAAATVDIATVAPSIFTAPGGTTAAAVALRASANGTQTPVAVFQCSGSTCSASPIDLGSAGDTVFLTLFGTGLRKNTGLANVHVTIGGVEAPVAFAGAQGEFIGLDQVNVQLPATLRGRGDVPVVVNTDGLNANTVTINVQ